MIGEQVGVEGEDHLGGREIEHGPQRAAESQVRAGVAVVLIQRLPDMPARSRVGGQEALALGRQGRRVAALSEDGQPPAAAGAQGREQAGGRGGEVRPLLSQFAAAIAADGAAAAVRIVELEDRRLGQGIGGTAPNRMLGVALHLDRPAVEAGHQEAARAACQLEGGGEAPRLAGRLTGRLVGARNDGLPRPAATGQAGQGDRGAHDLEESPAGPGVRRRVGAARELLRTERAKLGGGGVLLETAPVAAVAILYRWHVEQSVGGWMLWSRRSSAPSWAGSPPASSPWQSPPRAVAGAARDHDGSPGTSPCAEARPD